jgi:penicillin-binding protein 1B
MRRLGWIAFGSLTLLAVGLAAAVWIQAARQLAALEASGRFDLKDVATRGAPSEIFSRPLFLRRGRQLGAESLEAHLAAIRYQPVSSREPGAGEYRQEGRSWTIGVRPFRHADGKDAGGTVVVELSKSGRIASLSDAKGKRLKERLLEPVSIAAFYGEASRDRRIVRLAELPPHVPAAVLAIEDQRFYEHMGFDPRRILGAMVANVKAGRIIQGGSTLTQQLVKNLYLTRERSWLRKLEEIPLSLLLERNHSKQEILETYLNEVYLGQAGRVAIHGFGAAAQHFFGKEATELELNESALLAGMLRGPILYSPRRSAERAKQRRDLVLDRMVETHSVSPEAALAARDRSLGVIAPQKLARSTQYFVDSVRPAIEERFPAEELAQAGLAIYTSLDPRLQRFAERAVAEGVVRLEEKTESLKRPGAPLQAALVALSPRSGHVLAMVGGRKYGHTQFNRAVDARRQPGSVFKPVAALAALMPHGSEPADYTLATVLEDEPLAIPTPEGDWEPANHDKDFRGMVTLRQAIEHSYNVPMIRLGMELGPRRVVRAARRLGIRSRLRGVPSLVLGTSEVSLLEMTRAYGVLAAEGYRAETRDVLAVRDRTGKALFEQTNKGAYTLEPAHAHLVTSVLQGVVNRGTGFGVRARGFSGPVAGKTGTTDEYRDAWFIGYTPDLAIGVWVGFDDGTPLRNSGSRAALPIFAEFLVDAIGKSGGRGFRVPIGVERTAVIAAEGHPSGLRCSGEPEEVFLEGTGPSERCDGWNWFAERPRTYPIVRSRYPEGEEPEIPKVAAPPPEPEARAEAEAEAAKPKRRRFLRWPPWGNPFERD